MPAGRVRSRDLTSRPENTSYGQDRARSSLPSSTGALEPFQIVSSLLDAFVGNSRAAEIVVSPDGRFVYASNRGYDGIAILAVDATTGRLSPAGWQTSDGRTPRFFAIDPGHRILFAANEDSDTIVSFGIDKATGLLHRAGDAARAGSPVCIVFKPA